MIDKLKDLETLIEGDFKDIDAVYREYKISAEDVLKVERVLFAIYEGGWDAQAIVIFLGKDNNLYEIHSYHCSCYDLEGQWEPELIDEEFIKHAIENYNKSSYYNDGSYLEHLKKILDKIQTKDKDKQEKEAWAYELELLDEKENPLIYLLELIKDLEKRIEDLEN